MEDGLHASPNIAYDQKTDHLDALGACFDEHLENDEIHTDEAPQEALEQLARISDRLILVTFRGLRIAEEALGLLKLGHTDDIVVHMEDLPQVWFRPTLMRADSCEAIRSTCLSAWPM